jgi:dsDNA-specific endonuclease/ATPase MutS2
MIYPDNFESKIGFDEIRTLLRERCLSTLGKEMVDAISISNDTETINEWMRQVREFRRLQEEADDFPLQYFFDVRAILTEFAKLVRPHVKEIVESYHFLAINDMIRAKAELARLTKAFEPDVEPFSSHRLDQGDTPIIAIVAQQTRQDGCTPRHHAHPREAHSDYFGT